MQVSDCRLSFYHPMCGVNCKAARRGSRAARRRLVLLPNVPAEQKHRACSVVACKHCSRCLPPQYARLSWCFTCLHLAIVGCRTTWFLAFATHLRLLTCPAARSRVKLVPSKMATQSQ